MVKPLTGIVIIRCQLSEKVCQLDEWKEHIVSNPDFRDFCVKVEEIIVTLINCGGCLRNKDDAKEIKTTTGRMVEEGINIIFLTACMCRNIKTLKSYIGIKSDNLGWINTFESFCKRCIGGLEEESVHESCTLYQGKIIEKCPNSTASHLLEFIKDNYSWVNVVIRN